MQIRLKKGYLLLCFLMATCFMSALALRPPAPALSVADSVMQVNAAEFEFESRLSFPAASANPAPYAESMTRANGAFAITVMHQEGATRYLLQVSSRPASCPADAVRACQAAPARSNVAEIQFVLPAARLAPGTYRFEAIDLPDRSLTLYSRQLYSDPSHGQLGCQAWGEGILQVMQAVYDYQGQLAIFEATLVRNCDRTAPLPSLPPQDRALAAEVAPLERYIYHAAWQSYLTPR